MCVSRSHTVTARSALPEIKCSPVGSMVKEATATVWWERSVQITVSFLLEYRTTPRAVSPVVMCSPLAKKKHTVLGADTPPVEGARQHQRWRVPLYCRDKLSTPHQWPELFPPTMTQKVLDDAGNCHFAV